MTSRRRKSEPRQPIRLLADVVEKSPNPVILISADGQIVYSNAAASALIAAISHGACLQREWLQRIAPALRHDGVLQFVSDTPAGTFNFTLLSVDDDIVAVYANDVSVLREHAGHLRHRVAMERKIGEIATALGRASEHTLDAAIVDALTALCRAVTCEAAAIFQILANGAVVATTHEARVGIPEGGVAAELPMQQCGVALGTLQDKGLFVLESADAPPPELTAIAELARAHQVASVAGVPLSFAGVLRGMVCFCSTRVRTWSDDDMRLLKLAAEVFATTIQRVQNAQELARSERQLRRVVYDDPDAVLVLDADGRVRFANPAAEAVLDQPCEKLLGTPVGLPLTGGMPADVTLHLGNRVRRVVEMRQVNIEWQGQASYLVALHDVTERRRSEERLKRINHAYAVLRHCNQALAVCRSEDELLRAFCKNIVRHGDYRFASITPAEGNTDITLPVSAGDWTGGPGMADAGTWTAQSADGNQQPVCVAFSLKMDDRRYGFLTVGLDAQDGFETQETAVLSELASDLSFGLRTLRLGRERDRAHRLLEIRNRAIEAACNGIMIFETAADHPLVYVNPAFCGITGYNPEEVLGRSPSFLMGKDTRQSALIVARDAVRKGNEACLVLRNYRKDGTLFWNELTLAPVRGEAGSVDFYVGIINDISERKRYESRLEHQANFDALTGLPNRNLLGDRISRALVAGRRNNTGTGVLFIDLDGFKLVNDTLDHRIGDELLRIIARRIQGALRESDTVARYGGDEFAVVLPGITDGQTIKATARRIMDAVALPVRLSGRELHISVSVGASLAPRDGRTVAELLRNADSAMYQAKEAGRNAFRFFTAEMNARLAERLSLEASLRKAIERNEMVLAYQPQVDLRSGSVVAVEALVRWQHPRHGLVPPSRFIALAEETGLIVPLGEWVIRTACRQLKQWDASGMKSLSMAVNVSARQLRDRSIEGIVAAVLAETGLQSNRLELELTESALMRNPEEIARILSRLKQSGAAISIDDFGTGYSSLSYIHRFPIDRIKIDQSFTAGVNSNALNAAICRTIIGMAQALHLEVVAEGVETEAQLQFLQRSGCDIMQGFYFSPPVNGVELELLLRNRKAVSFTTEGEHGPTVLVVDDEANITRSLQRLLHAEGYRVFCANDTDEAFRILANHTIHVVISDQHMPGMQGTEFLVAVKKIYPAIVRIILTGYSDQKSVMEAINEGWVFKFLTKPWDDQEIRGIIRDAFKETGNRFPHVHGP